jgi:hypothetical protein
VAPPPGALFAFRSFFAMVLLSHTAAWAPPALPRITQLVIIAAGGRALRWPPPRIAVHLLRLSQGRLVRCLLHGAAPGADQAIAAAADQLGWRAKAANTGLITSSPVLGLWCVISALALSTSTCSGTPSQKRNASSRACSQWRCRWWRNTRIS